MLPGKQKVSWKYGMGTLCRGLSELGSIHPMMHDFLFEGFISNLHLARYTACPLFHALVDLFDVCHRWPQNDFCVDKACLTCCSLRRRIGYSLLAFCLTSDDSSRMPQKESAKPENLNLEQVVASGCCM